MNTIILDSSSTYLLVAFAKDNKVVDKICYEAWQRQSELMIVELEKVLTRNNLKKEDIDEIVVSIGPGSYTGVRVSLTIAKIMGLMLKCKVYAVSSLEAQKIKDVHVISLMNARNNRSYFGVYYNNEVIVKDTIYETPEVLKYIEEHKDYVVCGDVKYLGLTSGEFDLAESLLASRREDNLVKDVLSLKPVYLKD